MNPYDVALIQSPCQVIRRLDERDDLIKQNLKRITQLTGWAANRVGEVKLAVTGEYSLFGMYCPRSLEEWIELALPVPNFATNMLAEFAAKSEIYITGHFEKFDPSGFIDSLYGQKKR